MACNPKKDFSRLVAKQRISIFDSKHFFDAYVWDSLESMRVNQVIPAGNGDFSVVPEAPNEAQAFVCRMYEFARLPERTWWRWVALHCFPAWLRDKVIKFEYSHPPKLGEIHFAAGKDWNMEIVQHECTHATITAANAFRVNPEYVFSCQGQLSPHFIDTPAFRETPDPTMSDEEMFCYIGGTIFDQVYAWLWLVDTPEKWQKLEDA